jgi:hypothetical protein
VVERVCDFSVGSLRACACLRLRAALSDRQAAALRATLSSSHPLEKRMAKNTGKGSRTGSVSGRTQVQNPVTGDYVKRDESAGSESKGRFLDVKQDGAKFKGVATEPDGRRTKK